MNRLAMAAVLALAVAGGALADERWCGPRGPMLDELYDELGQQLVWQGISVRGNLIEIAAGPGGTWTELRTSVQGESCIVNRGTHWNGVPEEASGEPM